MLLFMNTQTRWSGAAQGGGPGQREAIFWRPARGLACWSILVSAAALGGCGAPSMTPPTAAPPSVTVATALAEDVVDYDEYIGRTEASESVDVRSRVNGFIREVLFEEGAFVKEGEVLFRIESDAYEAIHAQSLAAIDVWKAKLDLAQKKLARVSQLRATGAATQDEYEEFVAAVREAEAAVIAAEADARRTQLDVKYTEVTAPIAGRIDRALVTKGALVTGGLGSGTVLTRIVNTAPIYAYIDVDEQSLLRYQRRVAAARAAGEAGGGAGATLKAMQIPVFLQLADETGFPHEGQLDFIENRVDSATGTIRLRAVFSNQDRFLSDGLFVRVRIPVSDPYQAVMIPEMAVGRDLSEKFAYVVDGEVAKHRPLELGDQRGDMRIIKAGIQAGEQVVSRGIQRVRAGEKVRVDSPSTHP
jgi:RND family efflux transporter MFP subunit